MPDAVIVAGARTPVGKFLGGLAPLTAPALGAVVIREALRRSGVDPATIDEVIMGNVVQAGVGQAPARQAAIGGGVPAVVPAYTVNKVCGSGLQAVMLAAQAIRARQDAFALESHQKAVAAIEGGRFAKEIARVEIAGRKGPVVVDTDESPRKDTSLDALAKLRPAFPNDAPRDMTTDELTVTAGNAPGLSDGAAALVVTSADFAKAHGLTVLARITGYASGGTEPRDLFFAPIVAVQNLMRATGRAINDYDLIEANEAFASQALADGDALGWDWGRVNVNGGAIALGHPIGSSGARLLVTLLHAMHDRGARTGLATLCLGGGNAVALSVARD